VYAFRAHSETLMRSFENTAEIVFIAGGGFEHHARE
jgi:hypothetical protein